MIAASHRPRSARRRYIFIKPPPTLFLNAYFIELDKFFPLFGTLTCAATRHPTPAATRPQPPPDPSRHPTSAATRPERPPLSPAWARVPLLSFLRTRLRHVRRYGIFTFYLLFCVTKGCVKVGLRCFCIQIHPMRVGNTMMNSLLFNVLLLLLCSISIVQFAASAFSSYARLTAADMIFVQQIRNLLFFQWFFRHNVFLYIFVIISGLSAIWLGSCPDDKRALEGPNDDRDLMI